MPKKLQSSAMKKNQRPARSKVSKQVVKLKTKNPGMTLEEIGKCVDRHPSNVMRILKSHEIDTKQIDSYRNFRADILSKAQIDIMDTLLKPEKINDAKLKDLAIAYSILYDKERLETGKSTQNVALSKIVESMDKDIN